MKLLRILLLVLATVLSPILFIAGFNGLFNTGLPITLETWFLTFLSGLAVAIILIIWMAVSIVAVPGFVKWIVVIGGVLLTPIFFILIFSALLHTVIPITGYSYMLTWLIMIGVGLITLFVTGIQKYLR